MNIIWRERSSLCERSLRSQGWKHIQPPKKYNHKYNIFVIKFLVTYRHQILNLKKKKKYIWLTLKLIYSITNFKNSTNIKELECM
jgi:hypothetical protein